jgi:hypothetical protein
MPYFCAKARQTYVGEARVFLILGVRENMKAKAFRLLDTFSVRQIEEIKV